MAGSDLPYVDQGFSAAAAPKLAPPYKSKLSLLEFSLLEKS